MKKIFLIDDDEFVTSLYKSRLQSEGFDVTTSNSPIEACSNLVENIPDLLILDLHMPEMSGVDFLKALRSETNTRLRTLPVIVLSNGHVQEMMDSVAPLGVQKIFIKMQTPPNTLIQGIREVLQQRRISETLKEAAEVSGMPVSINLDELMKQFMTSADAGELHSLLLEIYKAIWPRIRKGLRDDENSSRSKLSRALQKLIQDLYDNPEHITPSTKETLNKAIQKLDEFNNDVLNSELELKNLLDNIN